MNKLTILVGIPGSGKSTYAKQNLGEKEIVFSSDEIRKELWGNESCQKNSKLVFERLFSRARQKLIDGFDVVIDATNINKDTRGKVLVNFKDLKIKRVAVVFDMPLELCIERDLKRNRNVGKSVIYKFYKMFEFPTKEEGFDEIVIIKDN